MRGRGDVPDDEKEREWIQKRMKAILGSIDLLKANFQHEHKKLKLDGFCVALIGPSSCCKSTYLESYSGVTTSKAAGVCTKAQIEYQIRHNDSFELKGLVTVETWNDREKCF